MPAGEPTDAGRRADRSGVWWTSPPRGGRWRGQLAVPTGCRTASRNKTKSNGPSPRGLHANGDNAYYSGKGDLVQVGPVITSHRADGAPLGCVMPPARVVTGSPLPLTPAAGGQSTAPPLPGVGTEEGPRIADTDRTAESEVASWLFPGTPKACAAKYQGCSNGYRSRRLMY